MSLLEQTKLRPTGTMLLKELFPREAVKSLVTLGIFHILISVL